MFIGFVLTISENKITKGIIRQAVIFSGVCPKIAKKLEKKIKNIDELKIVGLLKANEIFLRLKYKKIGAKIKKRKYCLKKDERKL